MLIEVKGSWINPEHVLRVEDNTIIFSNFTTLTLWDTPAEEIATLLNNREFTLLCHIERKKHAIRSGKEVQKS